MEIEFTYKEIHKISIFLKIRLETHIKICYFFTSVPISSDYSNKMNMLKIYPEDVDYGLLLPFVLNNLGNLGSVKQDHHKLPPLPPLFFKKTVKSVPFQTF